MALWKSSRAINVSDEQFANDLEMHGTIRLAEIYGVSKNTIADHRKRLGIQSKYAKSTDYSIKGDVAYFTTRKGIIFLVDADDADRIKNFTWYTSHQGYVICDTPKRATLLHRVIMDAPLGYVVDHINHEILDNRKSNLRVVTQSENNMNRKMEKRNKSGAKGVWKTKSGTWMAFISVRKKRNILGFYESFELAKKAREEAEIKYHGEHRLK